MIHFQPPNQIPVVRRLKNSSLRPVDVFELLRSRNARIWFDSSTSSSVASGECDEIVAGLSRYSFLSADPLLQFRADSHDPDPWPKIRRLANALPSDCDPTLPPFQGGWAGVIGYGAARWISELEVKPYLDAQRDDLPTPPISIGLYDWVIAFDHRTRESWLVCQGFPADDASSVNRLSLTERIALANQRADEIETLIDESPPLRYDPSHDHGLDGLPNPADVESNFSSEGFQASVAEIVERIRNGDSFQVNLAQRLIAQLSEPADLLYLRLREQNPAPFAGFYDGGDFQVLSSSPERFLSVREGRVQTRPIKGTVKRTGDPVADGRLAESLLRSEKDRAENIMIVDLMRNDLSRVCEDQSVVVKQLCQIERYEFVQHLVSVVEGQLRAGTTPVDMLRACFPGGSVTGAPKAEAMRTIAELEPHARGPYCGSMGYFGCGGRSDFNILIRTMTASKDQVQIPVGGGITARSVPEDEEAETWAKAEGMLRALKHAARNNAAPHLASQERESASRR